MKLQFFDARPQKRSDEHGAILLMMCIFAISFLIVAGLALDGANLYRRRLELQRCADAAVISGLGYRALKGWTYFHSAQENPTPANIILQASGARDSEVEDYVAATIGRNAGLLNLPNAVAVESRFSSLTDRVWVRAHNDVPMFLMGYIPGTNACNQGQSGTCRVLVESEASLAPANIALVLDVSGSMNCPRDQADCSCMKRLPPEDCNSRFQSARRRKIDALSDSVLQFSSFFNPNRDRISIFPFNIAANRTYFPIRPTGSSGPLAFGATRSRFDLFHQRLRSLSAASNTNPSDGLISAYTDMSQAGLSNREESFYVLFSDGAPTAGRSIYQDRTPSFERDPRGNDWIHEGVEWTTVDSSRYIGTSPLVLSTGEYINSLPGSAALGNTCGSLLADVQRLPTSLSDCIRSFSFSVPIFAADSPEVRIIQRPSLSSFTGQDFLRESYSNYSYQLIEAADAIRATKGKLFAVGLGVPASSSTRDPHQNLFDFEKRKDFLLRRVAFDSYHGLNDPSFGPRRALTLNDSSDPLFGRAVLLGYDEYKDYQALRSRENWEDRQGAYLGTERPDELNSLFTRIAKQILLGLVR